MNDLGPLTPMTVAFMKQNNIPNIAIFGMSTATLDVQKFTKAIRTEIPDSNATGYGVIDWEGKTANALELEPQSSPEYQSALSEFTKTIKLAKHMRPNIKWGFWGIPWQPLEKAPARKDINSDIAVLELCDVLYPMLYVPYNMDQSANDGRRSKAEKDAMISENLKGVFNLNRRLYKKILVFIWHRYYTPGLKNNSLHLIPLDEFKEYAKGILDYNYQGKKVDGLIWWGPDAGFYAEKYQPLLDEYSSSKLKDFKTYHDSLIYKYIKEIFKTTSSVN
jgi:hypothetical protein